jgi:transcriptional regulator with GAF, ATPase, and Fis domain
LGVKIRVEVGKQQVVKRACGPAGRQEWRMLRREYWLLAMLRLERAPRPLDLRRSVGGGVSLVLERLPGTPLDAALADGDAQGALRALVDVAMTLHAVHAAGYVHGDVAPRNVLVDGRGSTARGWLIDFGFAAPLGSRSRLVRGTPATMAPELAMGGRVSVATDLFALGRLLSGVQAGGWLSPAQEDATVSGVSGGRTPVGSTLRRDAPWYGAVATLSRELTREDLSGQFPWPALYAAACLRSALGLAADSPEVVASCPLALWARRRAGWRLLRVVAELAGGDSASGRALALTGVAGAGRRTMQQIAAHMARALGVAVHRSAGDDPVTADSARSPAAAKRPRLVLLTEREPDALQQAMVRWRARPATLALGILDRAPLDPRIDVIHLPQLTRSESVRLGAFLLRTNQLPSALAAVALDDLRQPVKWNRRIENCRIRRNSEHEVLDLLPLPLSLNAPEVVRVALHLGFLGEVLPLTECNAKRLAQQMAAERGRESPVFCSGADMRLADAVAESLKVRSPAEVARWGLAHGVERTEVREIGERAAGRLLAAKFGELSPQSADARRRGLWILRAVGSFGKHASAALTLAQEDLTAGRPRAAALMARSLLRRCTTESEDYWQALLIAVAAARRLGHWKVAARWASRNLPRAPESVTRLLRLEMIEALNQGGELDRAWEESHAFSSEEVEPRAGLVLARLAQRRGDHARARRWAAAVLAGSRVSNRAQAARALNLLAISDLAEGLHRIARRRLLMALRIRRRLQDLSGIAACELHLAELEEAGGNRAAAQQRLRRCLDLRLSLAQIAGAADALERLGRLDARSGDTKAARDHFSRALRMRLRLGDLSGVAALRHNLGILALRDGDARSARRAAREAAFTFAELGDHSGSLAALAQAALALEVLGQRGRAISELRQVLRQRRTFGREREIPVTLKHLADLYGRGGRCGRAARLAGLAAARSAQDPEKGARLVLLQAHYLLMEGRAERARRVLQAVTQWPPAAAVALQRDLVRARLYPSAAPPPELLSSRAQACMENDVAVEAAHYLVARKEPDQARAALTGAPKPPPGTPARVAYDLACAEIAMLSGGQEQAEVHASAARHTAEQLAMHPATAHALLLQANLLLRIGRVAVAGECLRQADQLLQQLTIGSLPVCPQLRQRIARARAVCNAPANPHQHLALARVADLLGSIEEPDRLFPAILRVVLETVAAERGVLTLRQGETDDFEIAVARNVDSAAMGDVKRISRTILTRAYREGTVLHSSNALQDDNFSGLRSVQLYRIVSFACAPLVVGGHIVGTIYLDRGAREGAFTPADLDFLAALAKISALALEHARLHNRLRLQAGGLRKEVESLYGLGRLVQKSRSMARLMSRARRLADASVTVLIEGETGVGKSVLARALHYSGPRSGRPFIELDCGTIPANLVESELFGHVRGAFTGADRERDGVFQAADGGTLFLDEIGNLPLAGQAKLLRVLQDGRVRRVGGEQATRVDVRLICASNCPLEEEVAAGRFREDLYFRINTVVLLIPPLRERRADIVPLAERFLHETSTRMGLDPPKLTAEVRRAFRRARWPGNIRQLQNEVHRLLVLYPTHPWTEEYLSVDLGSGVSVAGSPLPSGRTVAAVEREMLVEALKRTHWNRRRAAERLGMSHRQVCYRIEKYGLTPPSRTRGEEQ